MEKPIAEKPGAAPDCGLEQSDGHFSLAFSIQRLYKENSRKLPAPSSVLP